MKAGSNKLKMDEKSFLESFAQILFIMSPLSRMAGMDQMKKTIVMFGPMASTSNTFDESQTKYTW